MKIRICVALITSLLTTVGCDGTDGTNGTDGLEGKKSLVDFVTEPKGENCSFGGLKIMSGIDVNNNNILEISEIQNTKFVCNGVDGAYDKQITLKLFDVISSTDYGDPIEKIIKNYSTGYGGIVKFNIDNYINIDSATLVAYDITTRWGASSQVIPGTIKLELYDSKNSKVIAGSEIISGEIPSGTSVFSKNFVKNLPHEDIELGIKITKSSNFFASTNQVVLILRRE